MRLFIAVLISPELMHTLAKAQARLQRELNHPSLRWVAPENFHITLLFLGEQEETRLPAIHTALQTVSQQVEPFDWSVRGLGVFPNWNRPSVLWAGVQQGTPPLSQLARKLEEELLESPSGKPFHPHITFARFKNEMLSRHRDGDFLLRLQRSAEAIGSSLQGVEHTAHLSLMLSELTPKGSRYTELERFALKSREG